MKRLVSSLPPQTNAGWTLEHFLETFHVENSYTRKSRKFAPFTGSVC